MDFPPLHESAAPLSSTGTGQALAPPQLSISLCFTPDGTFDVVKYWQYIASHLARESNHVFVKLRHLRCVLGQKDTKDGPLCVISPEESSWYRAYVNNFLLDKSDSFMAKKFRNRFCLPYPSYKDLLHQIKSDNRFERWRGHKWNGNKSSSVELLRLGSLRYLGRGWLFDDVVGKIYRGDSGEEEAIEFGKMTSGNSLSLVFFQRQLVIHFMIMFACNLIKWPKKRKGYGVDRAKLLN